MNKKIIAIVLGLALVLTSGLLLKHRLEDYEEAIELYKNQEYEEACETFDKLGSYRKSAYYYDKIKIVEVNESVISEDYEAIFADLDSLKSEEIKTTEQYKDYLLTAETLYVKANPDINDSRTTEYVEHLKSEDRWTAQLDKLVFPWEVSLIALNTGEYDIFTNYTQVDKSVPFYIHAMVSGGGEIATTRVRAELTYPTGKTEKVNISGDVKKWSMFWVCINGYQKILTNGDLLITFFDSDNNQIGQSTIKMADYGIIDKRTELSQNLNFGILKSGTKQSEIMKYIGMKVADVKKELGNSCVTGDDGIDGPAPYFEYSDGLRLYVQTPEPSQTDSVQDTYYVNSILFNKPGASYTEKITIGDTKDSLNEKLGTTLELWEDGIYDWEKEEFDVQGYGATIKHDYFYEILYFGLDYKLKGVQVMISNGYDL